MGHCNLDQDKAVLINLYSCFLLSDGKMYSQTRHIFVKPSAVVIFWLRVPTQTPTSALKLVET